MGVGLVRIALLCAIISVCAACTCERSDDPARFCHYDIIVRGKAINRTEIDVDPDEEYDFNNIYLYTIQVDKVIALDGADGSENATPDTVVLKTLASGSLCGAYIPLNTDRVLFGTNHGGTFWTTLCAPNGAWEDLSSEEREALSGGLDELCSDDSLP